MLYPDNKRRKKSTKKQSPVLLPPTPESTPNPSLPDDLLVSCLARVSRLYYPTLSLVSKTFRSFIASAELYKTRSLLGRTESCLYVCLRYHPDPNPNPRWFTLCRKPDQTLTYRTRKPDQTLTYRTKKKKKSSGYVLAALPIPNSPPAHCSGLMAVGYSIYNIGRSISNPLSSNVSILDCRSHTWRLSPRMKVERSYPVANVFDGKIYVAGGCKDCNSSSWMEVFDPKTQAWELVSCPDVEIFDIEKSVGVVASSGDTEKMILCAVIALEKRNDEEIWGKVEWHDALLTVPKSCRVEYALAATV